MSNGKTRRTQKSDPGRLFFRGERVHLHPALASGDHLSEPGSQNPRFGPRRHAYGGQMRSAVNGTQAVFASRTLRTLSGDANATATASHDHQGDAEEQETARFRHRNVDVFSHACVRPRQIEPGLLGGYDV